MTVRKFDARLRKIGNSFVITIPKGSVDRFNLEDGDYLVMSFDSEDIQKSKSKKNKNDK